MQTRKICFIGFGTSIRSDDGLGPYILAQLEQHLCGYNNFTFIELHQIDLALAPLLAEYEEIFFIDAAVDIQDEVIIENIVPAKNSTFTSHVVSAEQLLHLSGTLYGAEPLCHLVRVRGYEFGFGERPSKKGMQAAKHALDDILAYLGA